MDCFRLCMQVVFVLICQLNQYLVVDTTGMDFARRQLEKYGWSDGKGLGKHENGISEALKPKLKRSVTGIGHDAAAEFNEHWWSALYDKAAKNVEVEDKNGKTKKIKTVDGEGFTITNSTWKINKKRKNDSEDNEYSEYFIRKAVLTNDGTRIENVTDSESDNDGKKKDVFKMTDEELFAACEGRTAHKGARHGLKALGKLARIARQEEMLLTELKYEGYSHAKKIKHKNEEIIEDISLADDPEKKPKNKKKKKRKRCFTNDHAEQAESETPLPECVEQSLKIIEEKDTSMIKDDDSGRKLKKSKKKGSVDELNSDTKESVKRSKKHKLKEAETEVSEIIIGSENVEELADVPKKKKKKKRNIEEVLN